ncbi:MAG: hypothetical protein ACJ741_05645 [Pyrinomonadaceae bacterium]
MSFEKLARASVALLVVAVFSLTPLISAQKKDDKKKADAADVSAQDMQGNRVLWRDPGDISSLDLAEVAGWEEMRPDLTSITYVTDEQTGYSVKYRVKDGEGKTWIVKVGNESRPEAAAVRLVSAMGYATELNTVVPCVQIPGAAKPRKDVPRCQGNGFADARFEARPDNVKRLDTWSWKDNPFAGTKEFKGLVVLMGLLNNWDLKDENNKVISVKTRDGGHEVRYIISDLGATFGKTGGAISHSRNEPDNYAKSKFVEGVSGGKVRFAYSGKDKSLFDNITVEDARWIAGLLARLSDDQIIEAFRAADFKPQEAQTLATAVHTRIDELLKATGVTRPPTLTDRVEKPQMPQATPTPIMPPPPPVPAATPAPEATPEPTMMPTPEPSPTATPTATPTPTPPPPGATS